MSRMFAQKFILPVLVLLVVCLCLLMIGKIVPVQAIDDPRNLRVLLEVWKKQTLTEATFVSIQLHTPLTRGGDTWVEVPSSDRTLDFDRNWGDIGDDYICFDERGGQAYVTRCTPFSNIAEIAYSPPL